MHTYELQAAMLAGTKKFGQFSYSFYLLLYLFYLVVFICCI